MIAPPAQATCSGRKEKRTSAQRLENLGTGTECALFFPPAAEYATLFVGKLLSCLVWEPIFLKTAGRNLGSAGTHSEL